MPVSLKELAIISAEALFEANRSALHWEWVAGHAHPERRFDEAAVQFAQSAADLVGYLNYIHPYRVQIVGRRETAYFANATPEDQERRIQRIVTLEPPVVVVADGEIPSEKLMAMCGRAGIPLFVTQEPAGHVIDVLRGYLTHHFAERSTRHGVFMDILGLGVMLTGESGLGKSELGLELISRGHGLVADDAVDIFRISQMDLEGRCPKLLQNLLPEVEQALAVLDARMSSLIGLDTVHAEKNPLRPSVFVRTLRDLMAERESDPQLRSLWMQKIVAPLAKELSQLYGQVALMLQQARVPCWELQLLVYLVHTLRVQLWHLLSDFHHLLISSQFLEESKDWHLMLDFLHLL